MAAIEEAVFHLMRRVMQEHAARWQATLGELTKPQYAVLTVLAAEPGLDQATAGERAAIDKATLTSLLLRLEQRGLISREIGADRRRRTVWLTSVGEQALRAHKVLADGVDEALLSRLSSTEREQLRELLGRLAGGAT
ncbi:MarR family winged helix-turn-helix transcriptional regulator [Sciscionella sediminilitoris]|uniref:MarR family winged helix-turn-helix transcriptional regulator n=1 Tax=Sciscionella sediminilitoris TaxID=1445613 RepID=UPI0004DECE35|nr:MarR family transcriptional regulator [Sciscionella sp. SE31]